MAAAGVSSAATTWTTDGMTRWGGMAARSTVSAISNAASRRVMNGGSFGNNIVAAIPDVIGQVLDGALTACFTGETLVQTPQGTKRIDEIKVGDWVFARDQDFASDTVHRKQVEELFCYENRTTLDVTVRSDQGEIATLRTTPEHPFAIDGTGWVGAGMLTVGMRTIDMHGNLGTVTQLEDVKGLHTVYNFCVTDDHTYFVSKLAVWVHNRNGYGANDVKEEVVEKPHNSIIGRFYNAVRDGAEYGAAVEMNDTQSRLKAWGFNDEPVESVDVIYAILQENNNDLSVHSNVEHGKGLYNALFGNIIEFFATGAAAQAAFETEMVYAELGLSEGYSSESRDALFVNLSESIDGSVTFEVHPEVQAAADNAALAIDAIFLIKGIPSAAIRNADTVRYIDKIDGVGDAGNYLDFATDANFTLKGDLGGAGIYLDDIGKDIILFDGDYATRQLLGTTTTPKGRQINLHAADRMANPPPGRASMTPSEVDQVLDGATRVIKRQNHPLGATLTIQNANLPGKPKVVVDELTGQRVITVIKNRKK